MQEGKIHPGAEEQAGQAQGRDQGKGRNRIKVSTQDLSNSSCQHVPGHPLVSLKVLWPLHLTPQVQLHNKTTEVVVENNKV